MCYEIKKLSCLLKWFESIRCITSFVIEHAFAMSLVCSLHRVSWLFYPFLLFYRRKMNGCTKSWRKCKISVKQQSSKCSKKISVLIRKSVISGIFQQKDISRVNHKYFIYDYPNDECKISRLQELFCEVFSQDFYIYI